MKTKRSLHRLRGTRRLSLVSNVAAVCVTACGPSVLVVNMMPQMESWEYNMDGEPSIAVDPNSPLRIAATAFTPDPMATSNAPIYRSLDGGQTWFLEAIVPGGNSIIGTHDINVAFSRTTGKLYIADIRGDSPTTLTGLVAILDVLREDDPLLKAPTTLVGGRQNTDQPFLGVGGTQGDILYVGNNDVGSPGVPGLGRIIDRVVGANAPLPLSHDPIPLDYRPGCRGGAPPVRSGVNMDGTVYVAFLHVISCDVDYTIDVVVLRDDHWGMEADPLLEPFGDLRDSNDGIPGQRVVSQVFAPAISSLLLNQRLGSSLAIAVDPNNSGTVYVAWGDQSSGYSLHLRRSSDRGQTWSNDLRTIPKATNPALAVNSAGVVGMLYQQLTGTILGPQTWDTHFETSADGFATKSDLLLARVPPEGCSDPVLGAVCQGDYDEVVTVGFDFYGVFSALNTPDATHFPNGVTYQRFADFGSKTLFADDAHTMQVKASLDPFFFKFTPGFSWP